MAYTTFKCAGLALGLIASIPPLSAAGSSSPYSEARLAQCHERAVEFSGYDGSVPKKYKPGGVLAGAAVGIVSSDIVGRIVGRDKDERRDDRVRGAVLGGLFASIKSSGKRKEQERKARIYRLELDSCMKAAQ